MTLRVSEVYASTQGEGPNVGRTTVFLRFGGCNLRCPGWPCDTQHAIDPAYRKEWDKTDSVSLAKRCGHVADIAGAQTITLTGGEPFLQKGEDLRVLVDELISDGYSVEAFTNGTILYPEWATDNVSMIMDWKLPGSGEDPFDGTRLVNLTNLYTSPLTHSVKFVCKNTDDFYTAKALWEGLDAELQKDFNWYYGRVWQGKIKNSELVELCMVNQLPWLLNVQVHNYIWPANERGR